MRRRLFFAVFLTVLLASTAVRAGDDDFKYDGFDYKGVTVLGLRDGKLLVIVNNVEKLYDLDKVLVIDLDSSPKFTDAEIARINDAKKSRGPLQGRRFAASTIRRLSSLRNFGQH